MSLVNMQKKISEIRFFVAFVSRHIARMIETVGMRSRWKSTKRSSIIVMLTEIDWCLSNSLLRSANAPVASIGGPKGKLGRSLAFRDDETLQVCRH